MPIYKTDQIPMLQFYMKPVPQISSFYFFAQINTDLSLEGILKGHILKFYSLFIIFANRWHSMWMYWVLSGVSDASAGRTVKTYHPPALGDTVLNYYIWKIRPRCPPRWSGLSCDVFGSRINGYSDHRFAWSWRRPDPEADRSGFIHPRRDYLSWWPGP
jgi:hypothetical protein